ncbi:SDR family oxidoreductase [Sphingobacterium pedocola]|uniref:dTDP-4-dehydrorhamnose reductase n=1 Tax=Sphingobacterium pedocola TaxID=2082722 RepID=A0ABR9T473_9SPHI|nr:SDR family oxidoreductase [Sphingobacterium pedocola]MBE8720140.1 NAD(P)-dependent oxidoreductase [Sphingobacterium pedocola]
MDELINGEKRILLTGSNGFLGQKLTDFIVQKTDYSLLCTSKSANRNPNIKGYNYVQLSLINQKELATLIDTYSPTHIVHTAATTSVEACENNWEECKQLNTDTVQFLAEICEKKNIHLTFLSTDFVFDGKEGTYLETAPTNPCNAYGKSKVAAEQKIIQSGCKAAILRTILVYGVIADKNRSNLILWAKNKLQDNEVIRVVQDQWRMPTWVDDLANACLLAVQKNAVGIYHISGDEMYSILDIVYKVADHWSLNIDLITPVTAEEIGQADNRPKKTGFVLDKAKKELGFTPTSLANSLAEIDKQLKLV